MEIQNKKVTWLYRPALKFLHAEASAKAPLETGGILMGYFGQPGNIPVILWATGPGSRSIHQQNYYRPDYKFDELQISEIYKKSKQKITYLGDWHTHPVPSTYSLSFRDKRTLRRIARFKSARVETPLMLILSYDGQWAETVWQAELKSCMLYSRITYTKLTTRPFE